MKDKNTTRVYVRLSLFMFIFSITVILILGLLMIQSKNQLAESNANRYDSYVIADELRQSSDDLTRFIRLYAATKDTYYKDIYFQVLKVRNGLLPRPEDYEKIYWDIAIPDRIYIYESHDRLSSINERMVQLGFTEKELNLLQMAESEFNALVNIELMAIRAIEHQLADSDLALMKSDESHEAFAIRILNDQYYMNAKSKIMTPIQEFYKMFDKRTNLQLQKASTTASVISWTLLIFIIVDVIALLQIFKIIFKHFQLNEAILEERINERTNELVQKNIILTDAKNQLVESEKMASLGGLVAGVAHEINTPIGIAITASSHIYDETITAISYLKNGSLSKSMLMDYFNSTEEGAELMMTNMKRAGSLINSFKQVAVDQTVDEKRMINISEYLDEIMMSLHAKFKRTNYVFNVETRGKMDIITYPGVFYQVVTNLVMNSLKHGFEGRVEGHISILLEDYTQHILMTYKDDGVGISKEHINKVFDPFFTTKRGSGGSGLGLNIIYNLISQKIGGSINLESSIGNGVVFQIVIPKMKLDKE